MSINASETREIIFRDCEVPRENLLAEEGAGFKVAMNALNFGRIGIGAQALGMACSGVRFAVR